LVLFFRIPVFEKNYLNMSSTNGLKNKELAEKALETKSFGSIFGFGKQGRYEEAFNYYKAAANAYKLSDDYSDSGDCYLKASECAGVMDENVASVDAVNMIIEAANVYRRVDITKAIDSFGKAIQIYLDTARIGQAARYQKEVAEIFEQDGNMEAALESYETAANLYSKDNKKSNAKDCNLKVATMCSTAACALANDKSDPTNATKAVEQFQRAAQIFESIGKESLESKLGAFSAKGYFFQALLCTMALGDEVAIEQKLTNFKNSDHTFPNSRECQFVEKLVSCFQSMSVEDFATAAAEFDRITPLDPWKTSVLLCVKNATVGSGQDEEGDLC
jgi:alpha-soluble NSF attachment protein